MRRPDSVRIKVEPFVRCRTAALTDAGDDYLVLVRSSFASYLAEWLLDAALEFTVQP